MRQNRHRREEIVGGVLALLNGLDPYGLAPGSPGGAPDDEYAPEADRMAGLLLRNGSIRDSQIDSIWQDLFEEPLSSVVGAATAEQFTAGLNALVGRVHPGVDVRGAGRKRDSNG